MVAPVSMARPRRQLALAVWLLGAALLFAGFLALGLWQLQRLAWKEDLMARLSQRLAAAPVAAPDAAAWPRLQRAQHEYLRVQLAGQFDHSRETRVAASTALGSGYWLITPLQVEPGAGRGFWLLVNRGFVPLGDPALARPAGRQHLSGRLRLSEPGGSLLQRNRPAEDRWYSRDVAAIAAHRALAGPVAPYFVDAAADPQAAPASTDAWPRAGLTVLSFGNKHLGYALTWFALAAMVAAATLFLLRHGRRLAAQP